ncbi:succinylglutamate desuccinylase/aspartoacylase family protein [Aquimarina gracilis]|uniref:Succinylglutamate desuccinylase/aspartoacylase family protein n=1 Tax=Aquimarina gracilis TaxID=874422 RepID=A0ABU5ZVK5_9FLAO|nr:succinylglutamate desuccinylase/aspartoacylase family protein [Aquimarina gracilis]MEB3345877.1 succinylglutamate desuccinylase/aspartoacylase family protein [Aquimarina gracilis]
MVKIYSKALDQSIDVKRIIKHIKGSKPGPTLIFIGGIHGNEPSGVFALQKVMEKLQEQEIPICGSIYALSGNLWALKNNQRYHKQDLNRLWKAETIKDILKEKHKVTNEDVSQQIEICKLIHKILKTESGPFYFMDLHTTSSETVPFLTVNDSLLNRKFTKQYPLPIILGIEEYLEGPLLSYINELGYVAFGFEAGQHDDPISITNHIAFIYLSLVFAGSIEKKHIDYQYYYQMLSNNSKEFKHFYEIYWRHEISNGDTFKMKSGFINFQKIRKGQELAQSNGKIIRSKKNGKIFMPLYQSLGDDGFFAIKRTRKVFLKLSAILRKIRFDYVLPMLPGVRWSADQKNTLTVNLKVAPFFTKQFFHLLGYRSREIDSTHLKLKNRELVSKTKEYKTSRWINK